MTITALAREIPTNLTSLRLLAHRAKKAIKNFHDDDEGMNTVEAIILLFVAAIVLLVFFIVIWPLIRDKVMEKLNDLFGRSGQD